MASATTSPYAPTNALTTVAPNEVTLVLSVGGKTGTVSVIRDGNGRISFSDGTKRLDYASADEGLSRLFSVLNGLADA